MRLTYSAELCNLIEMNEIMSREKSEMAVSPSCPYLSLATFWLTKTLKAYNPRLDVSDDR